MKKKVLFLLALGAVLLSGCERTEKPAGWDESFNSKVESSRDVSYKSIKDEIKKLNSMSPEEIEKIFGKNPSFGEFRDKLISYLSGKDKNLNKKDIEEYLDDNDEELDDIEKRVGSSEDEEKEPSISDFKDKLLSKIDSHDIKIKENMSYDEFEALVFDNMDLYKKSMTPAEKSKFMEENKADLNRIYQYLLDKYKGGVEAEGDSVVEEIVRDFKSQGKDNLEDVFGKEPTYEEFLRVVHSRVSLQRLDLTTPEIEELLDDNEEFLKESFEDIFK